MEAVKLVLKMFNRKQQMQLLPFVVTSVFFLLQPYETDSFLGAIFKILPILSLIGYVIITRSQFPSQTKSVNLQTIMPQDQYSFCILAGLCLSVVGDILIAIPYTFYIGGFLFMFVHLCYMVGIEVDERHKGCFSSLSWFFGLLFVNTFLCIQSAFDSIFMKFAMFIYLTPLFLAAWKASSAFVIDRNNKAFMFGCVGACLFVLADWLVIIEHAGYPIPFVEFMYMLSYYLAQAGWALSTSDF